ncbi:MAG: hypothetical protein ACRCTA_01930, partial [Bacilli bacterium]
INYPSAYFAPIKEIKQNQVIFVDNEMELLRYSIPSYISKSELLNLFEQFGKLLCDLEERQIVLNDIDIDDLSFKQNTLYLNNLEKAYLLDANNNPYLLNIGLLEKMALFLKLEDDLLPYLKTSINYTSIEELLNNIQLKESINEWIQSKPIVEEVIESPHEEVIQAKTDPYISQNTSIITQINDYLYKKAGYNVNHYKSTNIIVFVLLIGYISDLFTPTEPNILLELSLIAASFVMTVMIVDTFIQLIHLSSSIHKTFKKDSIKRLIFFGKFLLVYYILSLIF